MVAPANSPGHAIEFEQLGREWTKSSSYEIEGVRYDVYEEYADSGYGKEDNGPHTETPCSPTVALRADEATLNCLKWLLLDQKNVEHEVKAPPDIEKFEYASSDEEIWDALTTEKENEKLEYARVKKSTMNVDVTCEWRRCNTQFSNNHAYRDHIVQHFQEFVGTDYDEYLCEWDLCGFQTNSLVMFERHVLHHEMLGRYMARGEMHEILNKLPKCTMGGLERNRLPDLPSDFECLWRDCGAAFRSLSMLFDHVRDHYDDIRPQFPRGTRQDIPCGWRNCKSNLRRQEDLYHHLHVHVKTTKIACRKCGTTVYGKKPFLNHFLSQAPVKNPELCCVHCNKLFLTKAYLTKHLRYFHVAHPCHLCNMSLLNASQLRYHVANVHVKLRPFKCTECPKGFSAKGALRLHMHSHQKKEGGYPCPSCDYVANAFLTLRRHNYLVHTNRNYPYECHLCGEHFKSAELIGRHFRRVHELPVPEGFHRFTYRLDEGPVFHLRLAKTYEGYANDREAGQWTKKAAVVDKVLPMTVDVKVVKVESGTVQVELQAGTEDPVRAKDEERDEEVEMLVESEKEEKVEVEEPPKTLIVTRSRAAKKKLKC